MTNDTKQRAPLAPGRKRRPGAGKPAANPLAPNTIRMQTKVSKDLHDKLNAAAAKSGVPVSETMRRILTKYFDVEDSTTGGMEGNA